MNTKQFALLGLIVGFLQMGTFAQAEDTHIQSNSLADTVAGVFDGTVEFNVVTFQKFSSCAEGKFVYIMDFNDKGKIQVQIREDLQNDGIINGDIRRGVEEKVPLYLQIYAGMDLLQSVAKHLSSGKRVIVEKAKEAAEKRCDVSQLQGLTIR